MYGSYQRHVRESARVQVQRTQGHAVDGSSVQKHSTGALYPRVIFAYETPNGMRWGVSGPMYEQPCALAGAVMRPSATSRSPVTLACTSSPPAGASGPKT